jgi:hypothetical protein
MPRLAFESNSEPFTVMPLKAGSGDPRCRLERDGGSAAVAHPRGKKATVPVTSKDRR